MGLFLKLAIRNVFRNKRRSIMTEVAIVIGIIAIIFVSSFLNGMSKNWADSLINGYSGHLTITNSKYLEQHKSRPLRHSLSDISNWYNKIDRCPGVEGSIARLEIAGIVGTGENSTTFFGVGLDLNKQKVALPAAFDAVKEGKCLSLGEKYEAVIGTGLAKSLNKKVGDMLLLATNTIDGQLNAIEVSICGIMKSGQQEVDENMIIISLEDAQELLALSNRATEINVRLKRNGNLDNAIKQIASLSKNIDENAVVKSWIEMNQEFAQVNGMLGSFAFVIGIILFIIVAAGVANTMMMSILERVREIGTIMAIGTEPRQVTQLFILESLCIGTLGVIIGLLLGITITSITALKGIPFCPPNATETMYIIPFIKIKDIIESIILVGVMSVAAAYFPARYASKLNPIIALGRN